MNDRSYLFSDNFRWGTATSSHQVEGNLTNNDWWAAEQAGGYIYQNQSAGQACDWWNRAEEDFDRMVEMNQNAHRLSIEWSRIEPCPGAWDDDALDRYRTMILELKARGIEPMVTLHHFTNPVWVAEQGGWENEQIVAWFERYVRHVVGALGDLVTTWCTINEPAVMIGQGYILGMFPPGKRDLNAGLRAALNAMRAHAAAYHAIHELGDKAQVGLAKHMVIWRPWRPWLPNDRLATGLLEHLFNHMALMMVTEGIMRVPGKRSLWLPEAANTLDWLGVNYYQRYRIRFSPLSLLRKLDPVQPRTKPGLLKGPGPWGEIHPRGLSTTLRTLWRRYKLPVFITENGIPDATDEHRPQFIVNHLHQLWRTMSRGVPVLGYYFWSLVDNFEWTEGYNPQFKFGLVGVDFETQARHLRPSGQLYGAVAAAGGLTREVVEQYAPALAQQLFRA
jgi:beta-glucosidase